MTEEKKNLVASKEEIIRWQLKCLANVAGDMAPNDLDWAVKMGDSFARKGFLSDREMEVLESVYKKYS